MQQLRCIATYSHWFGAPKTSGILNRSTQQVNTFTHPVLMRYDVQ